MKPRAAIFDMDGLLIDSEPFWAETEITIFGELGVPLNETSVRETTGLRIDECVAYWRMRYPWKEPSDHTVATNIVDEVIRRVRNEGEAMAGSEHALRIFASANVPIAIASSSYKRVIDATVEKLGLSQYINLSYSAEHERQGKPHPGVFLTTAKKMGVTPSDCVVFEDSPNGITAAKKAGMQCIAVPDKLPRDNEGFRGADLILDSLDDLTWEAVEAL